MENYGFVMHVKYATLKCDAVALLKAESNFSFLKLQGVQLK